MIATQRPFWAQGTQLNGGVDSMGRRLPDQQQGMRTGNMQMDEQALRSRLMQQFPQIDQSILNNMVRDRMSQWTGVVFPSSQEQQAQSQQQQPQGPRQPARTPRNTTNSFLG